MKTDISRNMTFAIIADDLTGASDTGAQFAREGKVHPLSLGRRKVQLLRWLNDWMRICVTPAS